MGTVGRQVIKFSPEMLREVRSNDPPADVPAVPVELGFASSGLTPENQNASLQALRTTYGSNDILESDVEALVTSFELLPRTAGGLVLLPPTLEGFRNFVRKQLEVSLRQTESSQPTVTAKAAKLAHPARATQSAEVTVPSNKDTRADRDSPNAQAEPSFRVHWGPSVSAIKAQATTLAQTAGDQPRGASDLLELLEATSSEGPLSVERQQETLSAYLQALAPSARQGAVLDLFYHLKNTPDLLKTLTGVTAHFFQEHNTRFVSVVVAEALVAYPDLVFAMTPEDATRVARALNLGSGSENNAIAVKAALAALEMIAAHSHTTRSGSAFTLELIGTSKSAGLDSDILFAASRHLSDAQLLVLRETFASPAGRAAFEAPGVTAIQKLELLARLVELEPETRAEILGSTIVLWRQPAVLRLLAEPLFAAAAQTQAGEVRPMHGSDVETSIGVALGLVPEPLDNPEAQHALERDMAAGLRSPYRGQNKAITDKIATQIRDVGGTPPEVATVSVAFMSEHGGARSIPLFKVKTPEGDFDYVDRQGRRYESLSAFERENPLPSGIMVASDDPFQTVSTTPKGQPVGQALAALDLVAMGVGTVAGVSTMIFPNPFTGGVAVAAGLYSAGRAGSRLADRATHSENLLDRESATEWLTVVGGLAGGASPLLRALGSRTRMASAALRGAIAADVLAFTADGALTADAAHQLYTRWDDLSAYERMSLSMQIGFFGVGAAQAGHGLYRTRQVKRSLRNASHADDAPSSSRTFQGADGLHAARDGAAFEPGELEAIRRSANEWLVRQQDAFPDVFTPEVVEQIRTQIAEAVSPQDFAALTATSKAAAEGTEIQMDADGPLVSSTRESRSVGEAFLLDPRTVAWTGIRPPDPQPKASALVRSVQARHARVLVRVRAANKNARALRALTTGVRRGVPTQERLRFIHEELAKIEGPLPRPVRKQLKAVDKALDKLESLRPPQAPAPTSSVAKRAKAMKKYAMESKRWREEIEDHGRHAYDAVGELELRVYRASLEDTGVTLARVKGFPEDVERVIGPVSESLLTNNNLAVGALEINSGAKIEFDKHVFRSGLEERSGVERTSPFSLQGSGRRLHGPRLQPGLRDSDSEVQILELALRQLAQHEIENPSGKLVVYSERIPCPSCQRLFAAFRRRYPGIELEIQFKRGGV